MVPQAVRYPVRRSILRALAHLGRAHVGVLAAHMGIELDTVSNHLRKLKLTGFVHDPREGMHVGYALAPARVRVECGTHRLSLIVGRGEGEEVRLTVAIVATAASPRGASAQ